MDGWMDESNSQWMNHSINHSLTQPTRAASVMGKGCAEQEEALVGMLQDRLAFRHSNADWNAPVHD